MNLPRIASLLFNTPLLIRGDKGEQIINAIAPRLLNGEPIARAEVERPEVEMNVGGGKRLPGGAYLTGDGIAVWPIMGSLVRRASWLDAECGLTSYELIQSAAVDIFMDSRVRGVLLELDTPGGEAAGCFDCAELLRNLAKSSGKSLWAHANEEACSAGYALASAATKIWVARTAMVGSIGVVGTHMDRSKADEMAGLKWTFITAGEYKADGNPHEPLSSESLARFQADIDDLMTMFVDLVAKHRGVSTERIRGTKAAIYRGKAAVKAGLADKVGTIEEALGALGAEIESKSPSLPGAAAHRVGSLTIAPAASVSAVIPSRPIDKISAPSQDEILAAVKEKAVSAETLRCQGLAATAMQARRIGGTLDVDAAIKSGMTVQQARATVLDSIAEESGKNEIFGLSAASRAEGAKAKKNTSETWANAYRKART